MLLETIGFVVLGLAVAYGATRTMPDRFPSTPLVLTTGPAAALLGGWVAHSVFGPGHAYVTLTLATAVAVALVTLLIRPNRHRGHGPTGRTRAA